MLTREEINLLLESLNYTRQSFERYTYPTPELRNERLDAVANISTKLRDMRRNLKQPTTTKD